MSELRDETGGGRGYFRKASDGVSIGRGRIQRECSEVGLDREKGGIAEQRLKGVSVGMLCSNIIARGGGSSLNLKDL